MCNCISCTQVHELPQNHYGDNRKDTLFSWLHVPILLLWDLSTLCVIDPSWPLTLYSFLSLLTTFLVPWYQQCVTVHHVPKHMSCHKAIVVKTRTAHLFHDYAYVCVYVPVIATVVLWCGNSCIWANDGCLYVHHFHKLTQSHCSDYQDDSFFHDYIYIHIYGLYSLYSLIIFMWLAN